MFAPATMLLISQWIGIAAGTAAIGGTIAGVSAQRTAAKRAKSQAEQAERIRTQERKKMAATAKPVITEPATVERAEALPAKAKKEAAAIAAGRRRRRTTIATGPRGLFEEPTVMKPTLLGA